MQNLITTTELLLLKQLIGAKLDCIGGEYLTSRLNSASIFIKTDKGSLLIWGDYFDQDFAGFGDEFSFFRVNKANEDQVGLARKKGNLYFFHGGETINNIELVRLTVSREDVDGATGSFVTDIGIVFHLSGGSMVLFRENLHLEPFQVSFSSEIGKPIIGQVQTHYGDEGDMDDDVVLKLVTEYIQLGDALGGSKVDEV
jgi:hypothetical protein